MNHEINWPTILIQAALIVGPVLIGGWLALQKLKWTLQQHPLHSHGEKQGNLTVNGLRYPIGKD